MNDKAPKTIYLKDYRAPDFLIDSVDLRIELGEETSLVISKLQLRRDNDAPKDAPLVLAGRKLNLLQVCLDEATLESSAYSVDSESLTLPRVPDHFSLEIHTEIKPQDNTSLEGVYKSSGNFCTQCEPEGFRKITYYLDRPDVMAVFTTTVVADKDLYPVLLSNGNLVESGQLDDNRHWATWHDPHKKPSYLFALVAADLVVNKGSFTTMSGRQVELGVYVQAQNQDKCEHAIRSMQQSMLWDEQAFGREYDLDVYNIVAVDDFNFGAMENKGLNIFNSKVVLAKPETATDEDYELIQGVIAHEYCHNWSGNRVTCRDWFQLSLKEGFTVFRDQMFTAEHTSPAVKRIKDVNILRTHQFREDAGPLAHPVRPPSYVEINNFYTLTVYNKGAEVVRMIYRLLGPEKFRQGADLYFQRHDGQAVCTEDFVQAMEDASDVDLGHFRLWYSQAGTPGVAVSTFYDASHQTYTMTVKQSCPPSPQQEYKEPFHIPLAVGLLDPQGEDMPLQLEQDPPEQEAPTTRILELHQATESFHFSGVKQAPVPSLLRGYSAPVKLEYDYSDEDLAFLMAHDSDDFNRWEAGQQLGLRNIQRLMDDYKNERELKLSGTVVAAFRQTLAKAELDRRLVAQALVLPAEQYVAELSQVVDPTAIHEVRQFIKRNLALQLRQELLQTYHDNTDGGCYQVTAEAIGKRKLKNICLAYLMELDESELRAMCVEQFEQANNMTDEVAALVALANTSCPERSRALKAFYDKWQEETLVVDKWFTIQATSHLPNTLNAVKALVYHPAFSKKNPNKVRALIGAFCSGNQVRFHDPSGYGYEFLGDSVLQLNAVNPLVAARLLTPMSQWKKFDTRRGALMVQQLQRILAHPELSKNVYEIASKSLGE